MKADKKERKVKERRWRKKRRNLRQEKKKE